MSSADPPRAPQALVRNSFDVGRSNHSPADTPRGVWLSWRRPPGRRGGNWAGLTLGKVKHRLRGAVREGRAQKLPSRVTEVRSVPPRKPTGLILCAAKVMVKTTRPDPKQRLDPDQRVSPAPRRHPLQQSSARVEQLAAAPSGARHVPPAQRESPPARGRTAATAHTVPRKRFQDAPTGRKLLPTRRTSEHPQHKSDGSRNLPQSRVQTGPDTAGEGKPCTATEKAFPPSRVEDFMPFRTASQSFTGEGRFKAGRFSMSRRQVGPNLEEEAEKATSRKSEEARKDSEELLSNRCPGQTAWQRLCLVTRPLVVMKKLTTRPARPHQR